MKATLQDIAGLEAPAITSGLVTSSVVVVAMVVVLTVVVEVVIDIQGVRPCPHKVIKYVLFDVLLWHGQYVHVHFVGRF